MKILALLIVLLMAWCPAPAFGQPTASLSGFVKDATSGETLLLANVVLAGVGKGTATNTAGYYTLTNLAPGTYTVVASYIGYRELRQDVTLAPANAAASTSSWRRRTCASKRSW